jgi:predicted metalloprotease
MTLPPQGPRPPRRGPGHFPHRQVGPPYGLPHREPQWGQPQQQDGGPPSKKPQNALIFAACLGVAALLLVGLAVAVSLTGGGDEPTAAAGRGGRPPVSSGTAADGSGSFEAETSPQNNAPSAERSIMPPPVGATPQKVQKLADHPILHDPEAGLQNLACSLPTWRSEPAAAREFFTAATRCLDAAWGPFLQQYNLPFHPPTLHFPTGSTFETRCGTIEVGVATAAYYCENNLYLPFEGLQTEQYGDNPGVYLALIAHEYGHHVQEVAGIMDAVWQRIYDAGQDSPEGLELSRRKELQAQCFSGMFLGSHVDRGGSITREMYEKAWYDQETRGDDTSGTHDHGSNANYAKWWRAGAVDNRIVDCNTFAANGVEVS